MIKQEFSIGKSWAETVKGEGEVRQILMKIDQFLGINTGKVMEFKTVRRHNQ